MDRVKRNEMDDAAKADDNKKHRRWTSKVFSEFAGASCGDGHALELDGQNVRGRGDCKSGGTITSQASGVAVQGRLAGDQGMTKGKDEGEHLNKYKEPQCFEDDAAETVKCEVW